MKKNFYTHAGFFHADEVTAYAICCIADVVYHLNSGLHRLEDVNNIPKNGIVADIGRKYDPENLMFDHHQGFFTRFNGVPCASAGMIWKEFGLQCIMRLMPQMAGRKKEVDAIIARVDEILIQGIDAHDADNAYSVAATCSAGKVRPTTISHLVASMNTSEVHSQDEQRAAFLASASVIERLLKSSIKSAAQYVEAKSRFSEIATIEGEVITITEHLQWREIVQELHPDALFVVKPSGHPGNPWSLVSVTTSPESRECKKPIERPEWFEGFIHQGKWIAGGNSIEEMKKLAAYNGASIHLT